MLQNNLQYTLAMITLFNINNKNKRKKEKRKKENSKDASKFQAKICIKDSHGSIFWNDVNVIYLSNNVMLIKTTVKDLRDEQ